MLTPLLLLLSLVVAVALSAALGVIVILQKIRIRDLERRRDQARSTNRTLRDRLTSLLDDIRDAEAVAMTQARTPRAPEPAAHLRVVSTAQTAPIPALTPPPYTPTQPTDIGTFRRTAGRSAGGDR